MADLENYTDMKPADFQHLKDRVLLIPSDDDDIFNQENKDTLLNIMSQPIMITNLKGGHLALVRVDEYVQIVGDNIDQKALRSPYSSHDPFLYFGLFQRYFRFLGGIRDRICG